MVILIPARGGSKRIPGKALKDLGGKPLIAWTLQGCREWGSDVVVTSDDPDILNFVMNWGSADVWRRPAYTASDDAPDITWLTLALQRWPAEDAFCIRRPTSPFLSSKTLRQAILDFCDVLDATAMRAMRPVTEHPMKMWYRDGVWMHAHGTGAQWPYGVELWSSPTQMLDRFYVQTAGLEIIRRATLESGSLTGDRLLPLFLEGPEALDINTPEDWAKAEEIARGLV
jgi:CMP-N,N'-diacetyllegionaminic acid synthase